MFHVKLSSKSKVSKDIEGLFSEQNLKTPNVYTFNMYIALDVALVASYRGALPSANESALHILS